jgi:hypothetical protein
MNDIKSSHDILRYFLPDYIIIHMDNYMGWRNKPKEIRWFNFKKMPFRMYNKPAMIDFYNIEMPIIVYRWIDQEKLIHDLTRYKNGLKKEIYTEDNPENLILFEPDGSIYKLMPWRKEKILPGSSEYDRYLNNHRFQI